MKVYKIEFNSGKICKIDKMVVDNLVYRIELSIKLYGIHQDNDKFAYVNAERLNEYPILKSKIVVFNRKKSINILLDK